MSAKPSRPEINWPELVFSETVQLRITALSEQRFGRTTDAEVAGDYVLEQLSADDWQICRKFQGKSKPETYLYTLSVNLIEEYARKRYGRVRPPQWLKQLGETWLTLWKLLCLERQPVPVVIETLSGPDETLRAPETLLASIRTIKSKLPWCGQRTGEVSLPEDSDSLDNTDGNQQTTETAEELLLLLHQVVLKDSPHPAGSVAGDTSLATMLRDQLQLSAEQRLILKMAYQDGLKFSAIARHLDMPAHQPARIAKSTLKQIRQILERSAVLPEEFV
ncbi:hypothetical protein QKW35_07910 [Pontibacterium granulatum]|uniref:hypothetical protein n=1 Tax=Pontibacterium granulatum TaxID=2036029 RepID=UPI00249BB0E6|nr:hypothetical protein [Pontibacterium granulatum]MDI3324300.1 hypothetical protein [Pontibacterium granulatum]